MEFILLSELVKNTAHYEWDLKSQLTLKTYENGEMILHYKEEKSKNRQGGRRSKNTKAKTGTTYENIRNPSKCLVKLYQKCMSL